MDEDGIEPNDLMASVQCDASNTNPFLSNTCIVWVYQLASLAPLLSLPLYVVKTYVVHHIALDPLVSHLVSLWVVVSHLRLVLLQSV